MLYMSITYEQSLNLIKLTSTKISNTHSNEVKLINCCWDLSDQ